MKKLVATITDRHQVLPGLERRGSRSILSSHIIWLECPEMAQEARPGQYVMVRCGEGTVVPRPFSIHQVEGDRLALFFSVWKDGKGTAWLSEREKGDKIGLLGPLGNGFTLATTSHNILLVAGGMGVAPLYFFAQEALKKGCSVTLLTGAPTKDQLYPPHLLPPNIKLVTATDDGSAGQRGFVTRLLPQFAPQADQVFACGPTPMYCDMAAKYSDLLKDKPVQVSLEVRMGCGLGVCYGCTVKTKHGLKQVCRDGPVFELKDILWEQSLI